jgi:hypothetical protein
MLSAHFSVRVRLQRERILNVRGTLSGSQSRLRFCRDLARQEVVDHWNLPARGDRLCDQERLVVPAFSLPRGVKRDRYQGRPFAADIHWELQASQPFADVGPNRAPAVVLQGG